MEGGGFCCCCCCCALDEGVRTFGEGEGAEEGGERGHSDGGCVWHVEVGGGVLCCPVLCLGVGSRCG